jgi:hypothetical protein
MQWSALTEEKQKNQLAACKRCTRKNWDRRGRGTITPSLACFLVKEIRVHTLDAGNVILLTAAAALQEALDKTVIE